MKSLRTFMVITSLTLASLSSAAQSAVIVADHFIVTYGSTGLFGPLYGSASSNQIHAHPGSPSFIAQTLGMGISSAAASAPMRIQANAGYQLDQITFISAGDYSYFRFSPANNVGVAVAGQLRVNPVSTLDNYTSSLTASSPFLSNVAFDFTTRDWTASATVTLPHGVTEVWATWEKLLYSYSDWPLSHAMIENKFDAMRVITSPVSPIPEPAMSWLSMLALVIYFFVKKPKSSPRREKTKTG